MDAFEAIPDVSRRSLEDAARRYFEKLREEVNKPLRFSDYEFTDGVAHSIEMSRARIADIDNQLRAKEFGADVTSQADALLASMPANDAEKARSDLLSVHHLAARAERERLTFLIHRLTAPAKRYEPYDDFFSSRATAGAETVDYRGDVGPTLDRLARAHIASKQKLGRTKNQVEDTVRVLRWLSEQVDGNRAAASITKGELRRFRDDLVRLPKEGRGQGGRFADRLTNDPERQVSNATARRYWGFVRSFAAWAASEGHIESNPIADVQLQARRGEGSRSPEIFSQEELEALLRYTRDMPVVDGLRLGPSSAEMADGGLAC